MYCWLIYFILLTFQVFLFDMANTIEEFVHQVNVNDGNHTSCDCHVICRLVVLVDWTHLDGL